MTYSPSDPSGAGPYPQGQAGGYEGYAGYQTPPPAPGPYGYGYPYPYPPRQGTNTLAILALVFAFVFAPAAIVLGGCARRQIRRTGEDGWGLATAGMVIGIVFTVLTVAWIVIVITAFATVVHDVNQQQRTGAALLAGARALLSR
jgi:Domain of unknown function (DUF4190)